MHNTNRLLNNGLLRSLLLLMGVATVAHAQGKMTIEATAMGTSTQLGKMYNVTIYIEEYSTENDRKTLIDAFKSRRQDGLVAALQDMKTKGRVRFASGGVGNDIKYIIELPSQSGRKLRLVTDRWLLFTELYNSTRSSDYSVGAIE